MFHILYLNLVSTGRYEFTPTFQSVSFFLFFSFFFSTRNLTITTIARKVWYSSTECRSAVDAGTINRVVWLDDCVFSGSLITMTVCDRRLSVCFFVPAWVDVYHLGTFVPCDACLFVGLFALRVVSDWCLKSDSRWVGGSLSLLLC